MEAFQGTGWRNGREVVCKLHTMVSSKEKRHPGEKALAPLTLLHYNVEKPMVYRKDEVLWKH